MGRLWAAKGVNEKSGDPVQIPWGKTNRIHHITFLQKSSFSQKKLHSHSLIGYEIIKKSQFWET